MPVPFRDSIQSLDRDRPTMQTRKPGWHGCRAILGYSSNGAHRHFLWSRLRVQWDGEGSRHTNGIRDVDSHFALGRVDGGPLAVHQCPRRAGLWRRRCDRLRRRHSFLVAANVRLRGASSLGRRGA